MKPPSQSSQPADRLAAMMPSSVKLARKVEHPEHRANPMLNILNMTPKSVASTPDLTGKAGAGWRLTNSLIQAGGGFCRSVIYWLCNRLKHTSNNYTPADVLLISHLTTPEHLTQSDDFYMGRLAEHLSKHGFKTHTLLINHCRTTTNFLASKRPATTLLPAALAPWHEAKIIFQMIIASLSLPKLPNPNDQDESLHRLARFAQFGSTAINNMRLGLMISGAIKTIKPKAILFTFEGHGWERITAAHAHKMNPPCHVMGYHHTVLFPSQKALNFSYGKGADPDHIFTAGKITCAQIKKESNFESISVLGSVRANSAPPQKTTKVKFNTDGACLIAPEGDWSEVIIMAEMTIATALLMPEMDFILRLHPVLKHHQVRRRLKNPIPPNFIISNKTLMDDFKRSSWLCYRGSTMGFEAILAGLRPIYLNPDHQVHYNDPMLSEMKFRRQANTPAQLCELLKTDQTNPAIGQRELTHGLKFARDYLMDFNPDAMVKHLKKTLP